VARNIAGQWDIKKAGPRLTLPWLSLKANDWLTLPKPPPTRQGRQPAA